MDQIRNTIKRHEALFKEQVQALHKLYNIQKSAMQEIGRIHSHAQILACNSRSFLLADDRYSGSVLDGKHLRPSYATGQAYKDESPNLSLHPFYGLDHKGCGSSCMDSRGVETLQTAQSKPIRNFDLEKLPEEYMDESENQIEPNNSKMSDEKSFLVKRMANTDGDSSVGANLSAIQVDSPSLKQTYPETNLRILSVNGQEIIQKFFQECTIENKTSQDFPRMYLPAVGKSAYQDARHIEKQTLLHQGSLNFMTPTCDPVNSGKDDPEKVPEQANGLIVEGLFPKDPAICSQGSSTLPYSKGLMNQRPLSLKTISVSGNQDLNSFPLTSQTSTDNEDENPNDSDNGSNSIQSQYMKSCKDKDTSIDLKDTPGLGDASCEAVQASNGGEETVQSKCEEAAPHVIIDHSMCTNSKSTTVASSEKPDLVREGNEHLKDKSAVCETCENIAAEILLSMAPCTSQVDQQLPGTQTKAELLNFSCQRRHANNFQGGGGGGASESIKWPKTVNRRSTRRRPR